MPVIHLLDQDVELVFIQDVVTDAHLGICDFAHSEIRLSMSIPEDQQNLTLLHEITHYIGAALDIEMTEQHCSGIALGMYSLLRNNPRLAESITGGMPVEMAFPKKGRAKKLP